MPRWIALLLGMLLCFGTGAGPLHATVTTKSHRATTAKLKPTRRTSPKSAAASGRTRTTPAKAKTAHATTSKSAAGKAHVVQAHTAVTPRRARRAVYRERFTASSFADDVTMGDVTAGEDPVVREAAIEALGNMNGTALAIDPASGRILAMVNQRLALSSGAEPCSTIKLTVALAALEEGIITKETPVNLGGGYKVDLTYALAKSINPYFEVLGRTMGFERVKHYANMFGLGELAGYNIPGEHQGIYPETELPAKMGGVGRMCSFGEGISMTPLQLGAIVSAIANNGTLYYLQHPTSQEEAKNFTPRVKRVLDIAPILPEMRPGMQGAVTASYGTARSLRANFSAFPVMGKTGTCSNNGTRFGWFASYAETPMGKIVTVIFLEGGRPTFGPKAAELTGQFYRAMYERSYFQPKGVPLTPLAPAAPVPSSAADEESDTGGGL